MSLETHHQPMADISPAAPGPEAEEAMYKLEDLIAQLGRLIEGRSRESLQNPGEDGRWGVVEVLCHLRDWEMIFHDRIRRILEEDRPEFQEVDATLWPLEHEYRVQDGVEVFVDLAGYRQSLMSLLREADAAAWDRIGVLDTLEEITLREMVARMLVHDEQYLREAWEAVG